MSDRPISTLEKKRKLPFVVAADTTNIAFLYLTIMGPVFPLFLDAAKMDKKQIGILFSLMPFCSLIAPMVAPLTIRVGFKRMFVAAWGIRKFVMAGLIFTPWIVNTYGTQAAFWFIAAVIMGFSICRAVAETAIYPWNKEYIPAAIRGKFSAINQIIYTIGGAATLAIASYMLGKEDEPAINQFSLLFTAALVLGLMSTVSFAFLPGGKPPTKGMAPGHAWHDIGVALRDGRYVMFMVAMAVVVFGGTFVAPFVPLYLKEQIKLDPAVVVRLETAMLVSSLVSCYIWGWIVDRYGSRPVIIVTLFFYVLYPLGLMLLPRDAGSFSTYTAVAVTAYVGILNPGWGMAFNRAFFVDRVPEAHKTGYMALYAAWYGLVAGVAPLLGGQAVDAFSSLKGSFYGFRIDPYTPLFAIHAIMLFIGAFMFMRIPSEGAIGAKQFAGMFFQGRTFAAMQSMIEYNFARSEDDRIASIERLGESRSPLPVSELVDALDDPSFNVRMEAIVSMARTRRDQRLTEALLEVVRGPEPDLAIAAVWALGRCGERTAIEPLRQLLLGNYPLMAARAARALAQLGDEQVIPLLRARLHDELDNGLRMAYASALGSLHCREALPQLMDFLRKAEHATARRELTLAIARIIGEDHHLVRLWRRVQQDPGTVASETLIVLRKRLVRLVNKDRAIIALFDQCVLELADNNIAAGTELFTKLLHQLPLDKMPEPARMVIASSAEMLSEKRDDRIDFLVLGLHALTVGLTLHPASGPADPEIAAEP